MCISYLRNVFYDLFYSNNCRSYAFITYVIYFMIYYIQVIAAIVCSSNLHRLSPNLPFFSTTKMVCLCLFLFIVILLSKMMWVCVIFLFTVIFISLLLLVLLYYYFYFYYHIYFNNEYHRVPQGYQSYLGYNFISYYCQQGQGYQVYQGYYIFSSKEYHSPLGLLGLLGSLYLLNQ